MCKDNCECSEKCKSCKCDYELGPEILLVPAWYLKKNENDRMVKFYPNMSEYDVGDEFRFNGEHTPENHYLVTKKNGRGVWGSRILLPDPV